MNGEGGDPFAPDVSIVLLVYIFHRCYYHRKSFKFLRFSFLSLTLQGYPFQVGYCESSDDQSQRTVPQYTLYLVANTEKERSDWIYAIRQGMSKLLCVYCFHIL